MGINKKGTLSVSIRTKLEKMTAGKNPRNFKKKGMKKKLAHAFIRKEWYNVNVPSIFDNPVPTLTPVNKSAGQKVSSDSLRGRVFEMSLADLNRDAHEQRPRTATSSECSALHSLDATRDRSRPPATQKILSRNSSAPKCKKSW